jgi:hypothetical protein
MSFKRENIQSLLTLLEVPEIGDWYRKKKEKGYFCLIIRFPESKEKLRHLLRQEDKQKIYDKFINIFIRDAFPVILEMLIERRKFFIKKLAVLYISDDLKKICSIEFQEFPVFFMRYLEGFLEELADAVKPPEYFSSEGFSSEGLLSFMLSLGVSKEALIKARDKLIKEVKDRARDEVLVRLYIDVDVENRIVGQKKKEEREK